MQYEVSHELFGYFAALEQYLSKHVTDVNNLVIVSRFREKSHHSVR